jgi:23S rRNA (uracil1939-C5)-methyltransferase
LLTLKIHDLTGTGEGVATHEGKTVFVNGAFPGDIVDVHIIEKKKKYDVGRCERIITPSEFRVESPCPYAPKCGGCAMMEMDYDFQLRWKQKQVSDALERIGGIKTEVKPTVGMGSPYAYRNKMSFPIQKGKIGIYKKRSHDILEIEHCLLQEEKMNDVLRRFRSLLSRYSTYDEVMHEGGLRSLVVRRGEDDLILSFARKDEIDTELILNEFPELSVVENIHTGKGNVLLGQNEHILQGSGKVKFRLEELSFFISAPSFFQVNTEQLRKVAQWMRKHIKINENACIFDLYGGAGVLGSILSKNTREIYCIEITPSSIKDGMHSARYNDLDIQFIKGKSEVEMQKLIDKGKRPDLVIVDPPRKGLEESLRNSIIQAAPEQIFYMSCKPSTLARDLKDFVKAGYQLYAVQPFDFFPHTTHVETCVLLSKTDIDKHIKVN